MAPVQGGTFQPLRHRSGTLRERLHSYTKSTLGAGGSMNEAVRVSCLFVSFCLVCFGGNDVDATTHCIGS